VAQRMAQIGKADVYEYDPKNPIGLGGSARVYKARHINHPQLPVALKILYVPDYELENHFIKTARETQTLIHKNIAQILDAQDGSDSSHSFVVMRFVEGETLQRRLENKLNPVTEQEAMHIIMSIGQALEYAHSKNIVHLDVKPSNIILDEQENPPCPILTDFGLAKNLTEQSITQSITRYGSPHYMPPQQWHGEKGDKTTDIYALAAVFYEILTGFPAFEGRLGHEIYLKHSDPNRPSLREHTYLGELFDGVLQKAMAIKSSDRYTSVADFLNALKKASEEIDEKAISYSTLLQKKIKEIRNSWQKDKDIEPLQQQIKLFETRLREMEMYQQKYEELAREVNSIRKTDSEPQKYEKLAREINSTPAKPDLRNPHFKLHMPKSGNFFLDQTDSDALVEYICDLVPFKKTTLREIFLLDSKIPETTLSQFNLDESPLWVATHVIQRLQKVGKWQTTDRQHALAGLLNRVIKHSDSWDVKVEIIKLIFRYQLIEDVNEVIKLSEQYAVPPPIPRFSDNNIKLPTNDLDDLESLYNPSSPNYVTIDFFEQGRQAAQAVCRLEWNGKAKGTGFLVADDLVLTNYHVISDTKVDQEILRQRLKNCRIRFEVKGSAYSIELGVDLNRPLENFSPLDALDYVLIRLERPIQEDDNRKPLTCSKFSLDKRPFANIIHYPTGHDMKIVFRNNHIKEVRADRIYYSSDTEKGSSGAPVFNDNWQVIALHRAGEKDRHGNTIRDIDGNVVRDGNEGILLSAIQAENKDLWEINHD